MRLYVILNNHEGALPGDTPQHEVDCEGQHSLATLV